MSLFSRILGRRPQIKPMPALPPAGPRMDDARMDSWMNPATRLGTHDDRTTCDRFVEPREMSDYEIDAAYAGSELFARYIDLEPDTCMAKGFQVAELDATDATLFEAEMRRLDAFSKIADCHRWGRLYGTGLIYMQIVDGRSPYDPVDETNISGIHSITVYDQTEISISEYNDFVGSQNYGMPERYRISSLGKSFEVHHSRVLRIDGAKRSRRASRAGYRAGFGVSLLQRSWSVFQAYDTTHSYLAAAVSKVTQGVLKLANVSEGAKGGNFEKLANRLKAILKSISVIGDIVVDAAGNEDYTVVPRPMTGFVEAATVQENRLIGEWGVPKSLLMMQAPGGLTNGANSGDWQFFSVRCGAVQQKVLEPQVSRLVRYIFLSRNSPVIDPPLDFTITWPPIMRMTEAEQATIYAQRAVGRASDIVSGVISAVEARQSDDVVETYHLEADQVESLQAGSPSGIQLPPELRIVGS